MPNLYIAPSMDAQTRTLQTTFEEWVAILNATGFPQNLITAIMRQLPSEAPANAVFQVTLSRKSANQVLDFFGLGK